jgi:cytochrome P450
MMAGLASATDVFNEEFFEDPYPSYHRFRNQDPVLQLPFNLQLEQAQETYHDDADSWLVTGFDACSEALRNHQVDTAGDGAVDVVSALAEPLPILVIASLIGVPPEDLPQFKEWSDAMVALPTPETITSNRAKTLAMHDYIGAMLSVRRAEPTDDFMSTLITAGGSDEPLEDWEITSFCVLLLLAGNETTRNLVSCLMNVAADRPDTWRALRDDRSLIPGAIEESLRFDSPVQILNRWTTEDTALGGHLLPAGSNVAVAYAGGNRDPESFADPDRFLFDRPAKQHLAFGLGIHFCLGARLARLEASVVLDELLERYPSISRAAPAQFQRMSRVIRGLTALPIDFTGR